MNEQDISNLTNNLSLNMDNDRLLSIFTGIGIVFIILCLIFFVLQAWGLYNINKKLGEPYPWLSWIPYIQTYSFVKAGGKSGWWILWIIIGFMLLIIPGIVMIAMVCSGIAKRTDRGFWSAVGVFFVPFIMLPIIGSKLKDKTGKNEKNEEESQNKNNINPETGEL